MVSTPTTSLSTLKCHWEIILETKNCICYSLHLLVSFQISLPKHLFVQWHCFANSCHNKFSQQFFSTSEKCTRASVDLISWTGSGACSSLLHCARQFCESFCIVGQNFASQPELSLGQFRTPMQGATRKLPGCLIRSEVTTSLSTSCSTSCSTSRSTSSSSTTLSTSSGPQCN